MQRSRTQALAALLLGFGLSTPTAFAVEASGQPIVGDALSVSSESFDARRPLTLPATTACLDNLLTRGRAGGTLSGIAVAVMLDGRLVYHHGFGTVSPASAQPVLPTTRFRIGSVTKSLTATALLSLADEGRVHLHAPVTRLLPGFALDGEPGWSDRLTAHLLLSHQGGIGEPDVVGPDITDGPRDDGALAAAFYDPAFLQFVPLMVAPGTFYNYSNTNFMLAGLLAERAAGQPYREVVRRRVFRPLGMTRSTFLLSDVAKDNDVASGVFHQNVLPPDAYDTAIQRPAGYAWASVDDLARFMKFLVDGNRAVLSPHMWRKLQTRHVDTRQLLDLEGYGYGLLVERDSGFFDSQHRFNLYPGVKVVWHDGAIDGYQAVMVTVPGQRFGYAAVLNGDLRDAAPDPVECYQTAALETIVSRLGPPSPWPGPDIQRDRFGDYLGEYADRINITGPGTVTLGPNGNLNIHLPALDEAGIWYDPVLHPENRDNFTFFVLDLSLQLTGIREGSSGPVKYLRLRPTVLARVPPEEAAVTRAATPRRAVDARALERALRAIAREQAAGKIVN